MIKLLLFLFPLVLSIDPPKDIAPSFQANYRMGFTAPSEVEIEKIDTTQQQTLSQQNPAKVESSSITTSNETMNLIVGLGVVAIVGAVAAALLYRRRKVSNQKSQSDEANYDQV